MKYISHGLHETGGYKLETSLCNQLGSFTEIRYRRNFKGILGWMLLFLKAFTDSKAEVIITVPRLAWPVYLRNLFNKTKIIVVLHNLDENDGKPRLYFWLIKRYILHIIKNPKRLSLVVVSEYWKNVILNKMNGISENSLFLFPNTFDNEKYRFYADVAKKNSQLIHLGQFSEKIDKKSYHLLIHSLHEQGYQVYFSSPYPIPNSDFPITVFSTHEAYLKQMALSAYTVILNSVKEGWNRVAHESLLVGTQLIAAGGGGLGEIAQLGGGFLCSGYADALQIIKEKKENPIQYKELEKYHNRELPVWLKPIINWLKE